MGTHFHNYNPSSFGWTPDRSQVVDFSWKGQNFPSGMHRLWAPVFTAILNKMESEEAFGPAGYNNPGNWGYEYRPVTGNNSGLSFHAYGLAGDIKAPANPYVASGFANHSIVDAKMKQIVAEFGAEWGGAWSSPHDYMHAECHMDPDSCRAFHAPTIPNQPSRPTLHQGSTGVAVGTVQRRLNLVPAKIPMFGPLTIAAVKMYQKRHKITADGIVGPDTWSRLLTAKVLPGERNIFYGETGPDVAWWQRRMNLTPSAKPAFGAKTVAATKAWQKKVGLKDDGIVGFQTWEKAGANG